MTKKETRISVRASEVTKDKLATVKDRLNLKSDGEVVEKAIILMELITSTNDTAIPKMTVEQFMSLFNRLSNIERG